MTKEKMQFLEGLLAFIKTEEGGEVVGFTENFFTGTLRVLLSQSAELPEGKVYYTKVTYKDGSWNWEKAVRVNGIVYFKLISEEMYRAEVA